MRQPGMVVLPLLFGLLDLCLVCLTVPAWADTYYYVHSSAPDNSGVPNSDPAILDNCWQTIGQAIADLKINAGGSLGGKGKYVVQIQNSAVYTEGVELAGLTTTPDDYLTIRSVRDQRPEWRNDTSTVLFCNWDAINSYGALQIRVPHTVVQGINFSGSKEHGISIEGTNVTIRNCIFHDLTSDRSNFNHNSAAIFMRGGDNYIYNNTFYNVITAVLFPDHLTAPNVYRNNIFYVTNCCPTKTEQAYLTVDKFEGSGPMSDYNLFYLAAGTRLAYAWPYLEPVETYADLAQWQACYLSPDANSLSGDPLFVSAGTDYHLLSAYGHWTAGGWVLDAASSPGLDRGAPYAAGVAYTDFSNEPADHGGRVNLGAYANSEQASLSGFTPTVNATPAFSATPSVTPSFTCSPAVSPATFSATSPGRAACFVDKNQFRPGKENLLIKAGCLRSAKARISIFTLTGREVRSFALDSNAPGYSQLVWDGRNQANCQVAAGIYYVVFHVEGQAAIVRKVLIIK